VTRPDVLMPVLVPPASGLFGWPCASPADAAPGTIEVLGVPSDAGNSIASGARFGPEAIRRASLGLTLPGIHGIDRGDLGAAQAGDWSDTLIDIERVVEEIVARNGLPVVLGGDHAISFAAVAAQRSRGPISVVWFDAHTDLCEWPGGGWHNHKQVLRRIAGVAHVERIVQIGHRGLTYSDESTRCDRMTLFTSRQASDLAPGAILDCLPADRSVYISVDIDAVDPRAAPGTGHPVPGGLSVARLSALAGLIASRRRLCGIDVMEVNPLLDRNAMTSAAAAQILASITSALTAQGHDRE
jgi:agmatinase